MPKVTLLADEWSNYTLAFGKGLFEFRGRRPLDVPVAVALEAQRRTRGGAPLFAVEDLPSIVDPVSKTVGQNVALKSEKARHPAQEGLFSVGDNE